MNPTKSALLSLTCGSLSLLALTGCPNAGTQPPLAGTGTSPTPSTPAASGDPNASASTAPQASTTPSGASAAPSAVPSSSPLGAATVSGKVYDESGSTVSGAKVRVRSLNTANPFDSTVDVADGAYVVNGVPAGVQVEVSVSKPGWTSRTRVEALLPNDTANNVYNFGGTATTQDANGAAFFVSNFPEVTTATGSYKDGKLSWVLRFSEPLDADNRSRVVNALAVTTTDPVTSGNFISIQAGSLFLSDSNQATVTWDDTNTVATLNFNVALYADKDEEKRYSLALNRGASDSLITDSESKVLGYTGADAPGSYRYAFKLSSLVLTNQTTGLTRWQATHTGTSGFDVPKDDVGPTLSTVTASPLVLDGTDYTRFALTFNEPMQVFPQIRSSTLADLNNYVFGLSENGIANLDVTGTVTKQVTVASDVQLDVPFRFAAGSNAVVRYSTTDAKVVFVDVPRALIPVSAAQVKVRVNNLQDPAGNVNTTGNSVSADKTADNIKVGALK